MTEFSFSQMLDAAKESGGAGDWPPAGATYDIVITSATQKNSSSGKLGIVLRGRVEGGPHDGCGVWSNQYLSPDSPAALDIWFRTFEALGVERSWWSQFGKDVDRAAAMVCDKIKGAKCRMSVGTEVYEGEARPRVKSITRRTGTAAAPKPSTPSVPAVPTVMPDVTTVPSIPRPTF